MTALPDQADRDRARLALDQSIFLTAGAGAGKTRVLVDRICALVTDGIDPIPMHAIAAVTFTEKAAAELRDRLRAELGRRARDGDPLVAARACAALDDVDLAAIGTLHAFAARLLAENPIDAALPPVLHALDEVASGARAQRWWASLRARLLADPVTARAVRVLMAGGMRLDALAPLALKLQDDWDLVEDRCSALVVREVGALDVASLRREIVVLETRARAECSKTQDLLFQRILGLSDRLAAVEAAPDDLDRLPLLASWPRMGRSGVKGNWQDVDAVRSAAGGIHSSAVTLATRWTRRALDSVVASITADVLAEAEDRRRAGTLMFHDMLVLARRMLRRHPGARLAAHRRYRRLLLDEFQDTDPLQIEIAVRIVAGDQGGHARWQDCPIPPGSLFLVGDAKQSVYRFRRANITTFLEAQDVLAGGSAATLSTNFRSHPSVVRWVNHVFGSLIAAEPGGQPEYHPLDPDPARVALHADDPAPRVLVLGARAVVPEPTVEQRLENAQRAASGKRPKAVTVPAFELRALEARLVAASIAQLLADSPAIEVRSAGRWTSRPVRAADICVLLPTRTSLEALEAALDAFGVPYRTEASSMIYRSDDVRDLLLTARALDDPTDMLALVEALRTPVFGCGDDDLVAWRAAGGRLNIFAATPEGVDADHPVAESLTYLRGIARVSATLSPSELLGQLVRHRRLLETATDEGPRSRETWRRMRFVVDQARAWSEAERGSLRDFLTWASRQAEQEEKANAVILPELGRDTVTILTVHAAKGLEFPVVVLSGMTITPRKDIGSVVWPQSGPPEVGVTGTQSAGLDLAKAREVRLSHLERRRLLYVAATRAESRLVVSLVRTQRAGGMPADPSDWTLAELFAEAVTGADHVQWAADPDAVPALTPAPETVSSPMPWVQFAALRERAWAQGRRHEADSATDIAHASVPAPAGLDLTAAIPAGLLKEPRDLELPAWMKGRYGAAVGRAVHGTLQTVDLVTGEGLEAIAEAQAMAEGVSDRLGSVQALARAGWAADSVRTAAAREHHKEIYVGATLGGQLVEGYIDLLYRDDEGALVVVDYKTDADPSRATISAYQRQLRVYAQALAEATGERIARGVLVFCREGAALERVVPTG